MKWFVTITIGILLLIHMALGAFGVYREHFSLDLDQEYTLILWSAAFLCVYVISAFVLVAWSIIDRDG